MARRPRVSYLAWAVVTIPAKHAAMDDRRKEARKALPIARRSRAGAGSARESE
jgi:hypothetical protein